ncbi:hypothetical protein [Cryobacterium sp. TMT3-29-2]|uniref:hypothetical protein n=1 Tax=Cryobacterium sp. TMT3-29-2 TaxID=2555867 RepID=UPI001A7E04A8|nr:hypothetical protein [Cryobacterium sp. TMT3-29-2]
MSRAVRDSGAAARFEPTRAGDAEFGCRARIQPFLAEASASGLLAAIVAFPLVSVRPFFLARRRPSALG